MLFHCPKVAKAIFQIFTISEIKFCTFIAQIKIMEIINKGWPDYPGVHVVMFMNKQATNPFKVFHVKKYS